ncbi:MAG: hypothetical protein M3Q81_02150 [bacterium]|nr:hypothetical protein [bacterium]
MMFFNQLTTFQKRALGLGLGILLLIGILIALTSGDSPTETLKPGSVTTNLPEPSTTLTFGTNAELPPASMSPEFYSPLPSPSAAPIAPTIRSSGVTIVNFYLGNKPRNSRGDVTLSETDEYSIIYFANEDSFLITITGANFSQVRDKAELDFISQLGINPDQACELKASITVPAYANPDLAGQPQELSFCQ